MHKWSDARMASAHMHKMQMYKCSDAQMVRCTNAKCSNAQVLKCSNAQMLKCSNAQIVRCTNQCYIPVCTKRNAHSHLALHCICTVHEPGTQPEERQQLQFVCVGRLPVHVFVQTAMFVQQPQWNVFVFHKNRDCSSAFEHLVLHLCICAFVHLCICAFAHLCICAFVHLCICAFVHLHFCICAYVHSCIEFAAFSASILRSRVHQQSAKQLLSHQQLNVAFKLYWHTHTRTVHALLCNSPIPQFPNSPIPQFPNSPIPQFSIKESKPLG